MKLLSNLAFNFSLRRYSAVRESLALQKDNAVLTDHLGRAVQVDPIKPKLKPSGTKRLKLNCDVLLPISAFKFKLRRYTWARRAMSATSCVRR